MNGMEAFDLRLQGPLFIWGLVSRSIGLTLLIAFVSIAPQVIALAGRNGLLPIAEALRAQERDFPSWRRFIYFPSLLWINSSDRMLRALVALGVVASASIVIGGPQVPWAFALCYLVYLSLDRALCLIYPWESALFEAAFWGAFLPATALLPQLESMSAPHPAAAWAFRLLAFRVLFGFGKHKFLGATLQDRTFLRGFFILQPLPTQLGWLSHSLPLRVHVLGLVALFVLELIAPFTVFAPGPLTELTAFAVIGLMIAIHLCGNYGHFNWILSAVMLSWFDHTTARELTLASLATPIGGVFVLHTLLAVFTLPFDTWSSFQWTMWSFWRRLCVPPFTHIVALARWLAPFRIVHPYGVFPPQSVACARTAPVAEVTWDGEAWHELTYAIFPTQETSAPRMCAPHHERFDQALIYEGTGVNEMSLYRGMWGRWDPYGHGGVSVAQRLMHRVLSGGAPGDRFYDRTLERERGAPQAIRVRTYLLEPETESDRHVQGIWWKRDLIGPHFPPQRLEDMFVAHPMPPPELWHFEDIYWLERSRLGRSMAEVARGADPHVLIDDAAPELRADVEAFWRDFVPLVQAAPDDTFRGSRARVEALRARFDRERLYNFERICGRYSAFLFARLEPHWRPVAGLFAFFQPGRDGIDSVYELRLLTQYIISQGRAAYDLVLADPELASAYAADMTLFSGHAFVAMFRYEWLVHQSQKLRLRDAGMKHEGRHELSERQRVAYDKSLEAAKRAFGVLKLVELLKTQFATEEDVLDIPERYPRFAFTSRAAVIRVRGLYNQNGPLGRGHDRGHGRLSRPELRHPHHQSRAR